MKKNIIIAAMVLVVVAVIAVTSLHVFSEKDPNVSPYRTPQPPLEESVWGHFENINAPKERTIEFNGKTHLLGNFNTNCVGRYEKYKQIVSQADREQNIEETNRKATEIAEKSFELEPV